MKETEITVQVFEEKEKILSYLQKQGFKLEEIFQLNDWYYIKHDNISRMTYQDLISQSIIVRQVITDVKNVKYALKIKYMIMTEMLLARKKLYRKFAT